MTESGGHISGSANAPERVGLRWLVATWEGRIFLAGLALALLGVIGLGVTWISAREQAGLLGAVTVSNVLFGRATGLSLGYAGGLSHPVNVLVNLLVETVLVLLSYPLFVFGWLRLKEGRAVARFAARTARAAEKYQPAIRRYGMIGLMGFVWIPFWMTGPVVGCAIGYLIGLSPARNLGAVLGATYVAIYCWALALREFTGHLAAYGTMAPVLFISVLILIAVAGHLLHRKRN